MALAVATQGFREEPNWSAAELAVSATIPGTVSFVIPAYNSARTLEDAIGSCFVQTLTPDEIVVIDDGSRDMTPQVLDDLMNDYPLLVTRRHAKNLGVAAARNHGARVACGEYLCYLDADDIAPRDRVEHVLEDLKDAEFVYGQKEYFEGNDWSRRTTRGPVEMPTVRNVLGAGCGGSAVSVRRSLHLDRWIWWDECMCVAEDAEILIACLHANVKVACSDHVYSWMRLHRDSLTHRGDWVKMREYISGKYSRWLQEFYRSGN
jgi:glycosyltransferase involved in cell wall biosynthesis